MTKERTPQVARRASIAGIDAEAMNLGDGEYAEADGYGDERVAVGRYDLRDSVLVEAFGVSTGYELVGV